MFKKTVLIMYLLFIVFNQLANGQYFEDEASTYGVNNSGDTWSSAWADFNNDGYEDLVIANEDAAPYFQLYLNNYPESFTNISSTCGISLSNKSSCVVCADYDNDGDIDIYFCQRSGNPSIQVDDKLYKNVYPVSVSRQSLPCQKGI